MLSLLGAGIVGTINSPAKAKKDLHKIEFNRDIRPIIFKCFSCHGADKGARMMNLRLDQRDSATSALRDGKHAIVPGHPEQSEMIARIYAKNPDDLMPPSNSNKFLSDDEKALLKQWISEGAEYKPHWAFVPAVRPALPEVHMKSWPKEPIDYFVLAKLEENGLKPSPETDRRTLIRRVSLDLIGLPPTPQEVDAFLKDKSPNAYENVVDRLLASRRYGERMAMDWMDYSRYADSNGFQSDWERYQWPWRDWVINAYNSNMHYDEFAKEQIAGDLMPHATMSDRIATGFSRNHRLNTEGGVIPEEWRIENVIDRVSTTAETFLGLTAGCGRCHDHKYDPITQKDFYSLCAYFNNVPETGSGVEQPVNHPPLMQAPSAEQLKEKDALQTKLIDENSDLNDMLALHSGPSADWKPAEPSPLPSLGEGLIARYKLGDTPVVVEGKAPTPKPSGKLEGAMGRATGCITTSDNAFVDLGNVGNFDTHEGFSYGAWVNPVNGNGSAIARMDDKHDYVGWDLYFEDGRPAVHIIHHWMDDALKVASKTQIPNGQWSHVLVTYDGSAKPDGVKIYVNGVQTETDAVVNALKGSIKNSVDATIGRRTGGEIFNGKIDDAVLYHRVLNPKEVAQVADASPAIPLLAISAEKRTTEEKTDLKRYFMLDTVPAFKKLYDQNKADQMSLDKLNAAIPTVMIMEDMPKPRVAHVLIRGQYDHLGPEVTPAIPPALGKLPPGAPDNRLGLAEWIISPTNPLTSRALVNRMWERLFGTGICATVDDLGTRAEFPSHPELLDWLATEIIRLKWDQKAMWKEMVMSATYRQASRVTPELLKRDPGNRLLARGPRFRIPGEEIRDQALLDAGLLVEKIGGPSVYPYQPNGIWDETNVYGNLRNYKHATDSGLYRRSLYTIWKRTAAPPDMTLFDVPSREVCTMMRARTDTPMQALTLENDITYVEAARSLAMRMLKEGGKTVDSRLDFAFNVVLNRPPTPDELSILKKGVEKRLTYYHAHEDAAKKLTSEGDLKDDPKLDRADIAAYQVVASTLFNLDETITKE